MSNGPRIPCTTDMAHILRIPAYTTEGHEPMPQDVPDERWPATPTPTHQDDPARPSASPSEGRTVISDEAMDTVARAIAREHGSDVFSPDHEPYEFTDAEREQYRAEAQAAVEAAAPHIAAHALRDAARTAQAVASALRLTPVGECAPPLRNLVKATGAEAVRDRLLAEADARRTPHARPRPEALDQLDNLDGGRA